MKINFSGLLIGQAYIHTKVLKATPPPGEDGKDLSMSCYFSVESSHSGQLGNWLHWFSHIKWDNYWLSI